MDPKIRLTPEETEALRSTLSSVQAQTDSSAGFDELVGGWRLLVASVERGYDDTLYDYLNELTAREHLQMVLDGCSGSLRGKLEAKVAAWDRRFLDATRPAKRPLVAREVLRFWWERVPVKLGGELKGDLEEQGFA